MFKKQRCKALDFTFLIKLKRPPGRIPEADVLTGTVCPAGEAPSAVTPSPGRN
jgi:hypothetical protein